MAVGKKQPRAYELAKELGVATKELVGKLGDEGFAVKSNFSLLDDQAVTAARKYFRPLSGGPQAAKEEEAAAKTAAAATAKKTAAKKTAAEKPKTATKTTTVKSRSGATKAAKTSTAGKPAAAKPAATRAKTSRSPNKTAKDKGPQPASQPMPGLLTPAKKEPEVEPESTAAEAKPAEKTATPSQAPRTEKKKEGSGESRERSGGSRSGSDRSERTESHRAPRVTRPRISAGGSSGKPVNAPANQPVRRVTPPAPPRLVYYGPSPAPADYEKARPKLPKGAGSSDGADGSGSGPQIRAQALAGGRTVQGSVTRSVTPPARTGRPDASKGKTIFRFDEKEEEQKRKEREKEQKKEAERLRKDAANKAQRQKQETYRQRQRQRSEDRTRSVPSSSSLPVRQKEPEQRTLELEETIVVSDLANLLSVTPVELVTKMIGLGTMASINQRIDFEVAQIVTEEYGIKAVLSDEDVQVQETNEPVDPAKLKPRAPVVTVMGHVDHGKTTLLDAIRKTKVVDGEHGGITQHIGAYQVKLPTGQLITFLDTPGHEAFTAMRAHGAKVTDIAILVVAADDGVMPQTEEAVHHAQAANVPIIVAVNKIDKPDADPDKVKQELTKLNLVPEEWGGKTICVPVSATTGDNLQQLLEMIVLQAEMLELKADPDRRAKGVILESQLDKGRGHVATVLVEEGTLKVGDPFSAGTAYGKVRALMNDEGKKIKEAGPGMPVNVMGFNSGPEASTSFTVYESEAQAREIAERRERRHRVQKGTTSAPEHLSLDDLFAKIEEGSLKELKIVIKADTNGSVTALSDALVKITNEEVKVSVIHGAVGAITESDVMLAAASDAVIVGFHVRPGGAVRKLAEKEKVDIRLYSIIYEAVEEVEMAMKGMLAPTFQEVVYGHAEVRQPFSVPKIGRVAGSYVTDGKIVRNSEARLIRDGVEVYTGKIASLRRFKDDAKEVATGFECGIGLHNFQDVKEKDVIEVFRKEEIPRI